MAANKTEEIKIEEVIKNLFKIKTNGVTESIRNDASDILYEIIRFYKCQKIIKGLKSK